MQKRPIRLISLEAGTKLESVPHRTERQGLAWLEVYAVVDGGSSERERERERERPKHFLLFSFLFFFFFFFFRTERKEGKKEETGLGPKKAPKTERKEKTKLIRRKGATPSSSRKENQTRAVIIDKGSE
jgi:hypothetical protein